MIRPTRGYVLIEPDKAEEKTASGFYVPDNAQEKPQKGTVIEVGKLHDQGPKTTTTDTNSSFLLSSYQDYSIVYPPTKKGDKVYYKRWGGTDIKEDGKEYVIVKFEDILGIIE